MSGLSPTAVSRYRSGARAPNPQELLVLAQALETTMEWLLAGDAGNWQSSVQAAFKERVVAAEESRVCEADISPAMLSDDPLSEIESLREENRRLREIIGGVRALVAEQTVPVPPKGRLSYRSATKR